MATVTLDKINKVYPNGFHAIHDLDLEIADTEFLVLVGPSGCGKSTALRMIAGLEEISGGEMRIGDNVVNDVEPKDRDIAMVFQNYALYPHMTVRDNIGFALKLAKTPKAEIDARVEEAARILELTEQLGKRPGQLSGGQRQRVAMGRAIVREPSAFLMDEPLSNLDAKLRMQMRAEIARLQRDLGVTTVYVTHDQVEAMTMGHRIAVLNRGSLQQLGTPTELYQWPSNVFVAQFIGSPAMNLLPITVAGKGQLQLGSRRFLPEGPSGDALLYWQEAGGSETLTGGLRAEHLRLAPATNRNLPAEVCHVEGLGNEQLLTCRLEEGSHLVQLRADPGEPLTPGETVHLEIDPKGWRFFDANGEAIPMAPEPIAEPAAGPEPVLPSLG